MKAGRRIAILGDMLELGADAPAYHEKLAKDLPGIDGVYCVGPLMRHLYDLAAGGAGLGWHEDPATLEPEEIAALLRGGDVVVVKGSKKMFWVNKFVPQAAGRLAGKGVNWPHLTAAVSARRFAQYPRCMTKICLV